MNAIVGGVFFGAVGLVVGLVLATLIYVAIKYPIEFTLIVSVVVASVILRNGSIAEAWINIKKDLRIGVEE